MTIEEFIELAKPQIGDVRTEDIITQINLAVIHDILVDKGICTKQEIDSGVEQYLAGAAKNLDVFKRPE
jgi:hypothetical protein